MIPLTPREAVVHLVEKQCEATKQKPWEIWKTLYAKFEVDTKYPWRRFAYNAGQTNLDYIEEHGGMPELLTLAQSTLTKAPALPEIKKAPVQGRFLDKEETA